jgi:hypothetical protein
MARGARTTPVQVMMPAGGFRDDVEELPGRHPEAKPEAAHAPHPELHTRTSGNSVQAETAYEIELEL